MKIQCVTCDTMIYPVPVIFEGEVVGTENMCSTCRKKGRMKASEKEIRREFHTVTTVESELFNKSIQ